MVSHFTSVSFPSWKYILYTWLAIHLCGIYSKNNYYYSGSPQCQWVTSGRYLHVPHRSKTRSSVNIHHYSPPLRGINKFPKYKDINITLERIMILISSNLLFQKLWLLYTYTQSRKGWGLFRKVHWRSALKVKVKEHGCKSQHTPRPWHLPLCI